MSAATSTLEMTSISYGRKGTSEALCWLSVAEREAAWLLGVRILPVVGGYNIALHVLRAFWHKYGHM